MRLSTGLQKLYGTVFKPTYYFDNTQDTFRLITRLSRYRNNYQRVKDIKTSHMIHQT